MNILLFGPNGSGKGTQGAVLQKQFSVAHVESGVIFRDNISKGTDLGKKAKQYIDRGELVPDDITIPMILDRLKQPDCVKGWLLDGFPRNFNQAKQLDEALAKANLKLDYITENNLDAVFNLRHQWGKTLNSEWTMEYNKSFQSREELPCQAWQADLHA